MTTITKLQIGLEILQSYNHNPKVYSKDNNLVVEIEIESVREEDRKMLHDMDWFTIGINLFYFKTN